MERFKRYVLGVVGCGMLSSGFAAAPTGWYMTVQDVNALHRAAPTAKIMYGKAPEAFGLLRLPAGKGPHPVVVLIHGGCWLSTVATVENLEPLADALRDAGFATWNIEYRTVDSPEGGFPATFLDVASGVDYLRQLAPKYQLSLSKVVVIGHSAGGQLALWTAARDKLPTNSALYMANPLPVSGVIGLGGVANLKAAQLAAEKVCGRNVIGRLVGYPAGAVPNARYEETSPIEMLPMHGKQVLIYGSADEVVPAIMGQQYVAAARAKGEAVSLEMVADAAHHEYTAPNSVVWPVLLKTVRQMTGIYP